MILPLRKLLLLSASVTLIAIWVLSLSSCVQQAAPPPAPPPKKTMPIWNTMSRTGPTAAYAPASRSMSAPQAPHQHNPANTSYAEQHKYYESQSYDQIKKLAFSDEGSTYSIFLEYRIQPGDVLDVLYHVETYKLQEEFKISSDHEVSIRFVNLPELDTTQLVRPDGTISLPYLGSVQVVGKTVEGLRSELQATYGQILVAPQIYVMIPQFRAAIEDFKRDLHTAPRGLSRLVTVRPDGYATFAMMGDVFVADQTIPEVNAVLNQRYNEIIAGLKVDLFLETHAGSRIYVLGEVNTPGDYKILKPTLPLQAIVLAGGATTEARLSDVVIVRRYGDKMIAKKINIAETINPKKDSSYQFLKPDDIVFVPRRSTSKMAEIAREIGDIIFFRGWSLGVSYDIDNGAD